MTWRPELPYDGLPPLPPTQELETKKVLKLTIEARDALARFDAKANSLHNPTVLINAIPLLEAQASSEIENIVTTTDELFVAEAIESTASPAAREALRYRTALLRGWESLQRKPLSALTAAEVCNAIRGHNEGFRKGDGTGGLYIGEPVTHHRIYTPPADPQSLIALRDNWSMFLNDKTNDIDPLVKMAVAHYQFEAIHPFNDGNGRTGRIMNILMLCDAGLLAKPLLYLSRYIIETKDDYYKLLRSVTKDNQWELWIAYIIQGVLDTATRSLNVISQIEDVQRHLLDSIRQISGTANKDLQATLMQQPYSRIKNVMDICKVSRPTATKWLKELEENGELSSMQIGRELLYINTKFMNVLKSA